MSQKSVTSTFMLKKEDVERKWYLIDASGKTLGKVAALAATLLNGKHRPEYTPHVDCGDCVVIINASEIVLTGKKLDQKMYYHHSGYVGGLKSVKYRHIMSTRPEMAVMLAVKGMLPKNKIGAASLTRLHVFKNAEHKQQAQKPEAIEVK
jgi:large subunit ribosomal protein L13